MAPTYATLVLGYLEIKLYEIAEDRYGQEFRLYLENNWKRFLDDCFILWTKSDNELSIFHEILDSLHSDLSFTMESSTKELPFLDVMVKCLNGKIITDIYYKPTDTKQYLMYNSCHPKHIKNNIPFNLARRICSIVSETDTINERLSELKQFLKNRNYPERVIDIGIEKAKSISKEELRKEKEHKEENEIIPFISTFNPKNPEVFTLIQENIPILKTDERMNRIVQHGNFIKSKRQSKNLKKLLTKARFEEETIPITPTVKKCGRSNCGTCEHLQEKSTFEFKNNKTFTVKCNMDCSNKSVIYVMTCNGCNEFYIGQTSDFRKRVTVHKQQIRQPEYQQIPLSGHIRNCAKDKSPMFFIFPMYNFFHKTTETERTIKERHFIEIFNPKLNV